MSKKRRTKKEKLVASTRHDFSQVLTLPKVQHLTQNINIAPQVITAAVARDHSYVSLDIKKTLLITTAIVALDILFFLILKFKIINFSGISF